MPKDKYPSIFSCQMEAIVFIILQIFFATSMVLKIWEYPRIFPGTFHHMTCLDQLPGVSVSLEVGGFSW